MTNLLVYCDNVKIIIGLSVSDRILPIKPIQYLGSAHASSLCHSLPEQS